MESVPFAITPSGPFFHLQLSVINSTESLFAKYDKMFNREKSVNTSIPCLSTGTALYFAKVSAVSWNGAGKCKGVTMKV